MQGMCRVPPWMDTEVTDVSLWLRLRLGPGALATPCSGRHHPVDTQEVEMETPSGVAVGMWYILIVHSETGHSAEPSQRQGQHCAYRGSAWDRHT